MIIVFILNNHLSSLLIEISFDFLGDLIDLSQYDVHTIGDLLKLYLGMLPEPILPWDVSDTLFLDYLEMSSGLCQ